MTPLRSVPTDPPPEGGGSVGAHLAELLKRASRGDEGAFAEWYDATSARAFGLAVRVLRDRAQAEERTVDHDSTAEAATASLEATRVRTALSDLTLKQRQAVELAFLGGYTHTEVARMLDLPIGTAKTRIRDGLIRLRDALSVGEVAQA